MRMIRVLGTALAAAAALTACVPHTAPPAPQPPPVPRPVPPPPPAPAPPAPLAAWQDGPLSPGDWGYDSRSRPRAAFGAEGPIFVVECTAARQVSLARIGAATGSALTVRTTSGERSLPGTSQPGGSVAALAASDPLLDEMAFSRGRFLVQAGGLPDLTLPSWPELARVVEDCRGQ